LLEHFLREENGILAKAGIGNGKQGIRIAWILCGPTLPIFTLMRRNRPIGGNGGILTMGKTVAVDFYQVMLHVDKPFFQ